MSTKIQWTDETWNPLTGCTKVSPGCAHCYAERESRRLRAMNVPQYQNAVDDQGRWTGKITLIENKLTEPLHWKKPRMIFVNSMSDLFHPDVPVEFIDKVFAVMALADRHTFQVLTKRPERMAEYFAFELTTAMCHSTQARVAYWATLFAGERGENTLDAYWDMFLERWPLPNVWLGTSVENQKTADERIEHLFECPAAVRFLSCEPLLGPVDLTMVKSVPRPGTVIVGTVLGTDGTRFSPCGASGRGLDWVIVGGESGPGARPMDLDWARSLRDQCALVGVPFFFKQWGGVNKKKAGRELDGCEWDEMPNQAVASSEVSDDKR